MLRTALAVCGLQLLASIPTANATRYGARRTLYYQDSDCRLETFREFAYDALSIEMDGAASQGATSMFVSLQASLLCVLYLRFPPFHVSFFLS